MARTLKPEDRISRYRIIGPLGAGGMGEVYRARDESLDRDVALKILPPEVVRSEDRVRRFVLEARSASSLNHPGIVTIYEIGNDRVRRSEGSREGVTPDAGKGAGRGPSAGPHELVHFIAMELVAGETLAAKIHHERTDLKTLIGYLAQAAEGLAKAHAAGIVHRDLKPGNIMVSNDGFAKVLDFGLAKLTERLARGAAFKGGPKQGFEGPSGTADSGAQGDPHNADFDSTSAPTDSVQRTGEGIVLGTTGYMSPEQVQGKPVDPRSDIFSFGCILYEAATRRGPFEADTGAERMARILRENPQPIEELNPEAPAELRKLIRRCLTKDPNQRLDSMKTLAIELREIVEEFDALSASASSGSRASSIVTLEPPRRRFTPVALALGVAAAAVVVGIAGGVVGIRALRRGLSEASAAPFQSMKMTTLTSDGIVGDAALSPDGRYLVYTRWHDDKHGLWVRQVATGSDAEILPPQKLPLGESGPDRSGGLTFSTDGEYVFYTMRDPEASLYRALYQIPSLGGPPRKRAFDVDSAVTFAPDGRRVCFLRFVSPMKLTALIVLDLESGQEQTLATVASPKFLASPSWSPDGERIAAAEVDPAGGWKARVVAFRTVDGGRETIGSDPWLRIGRIAWLPDGRGLVMAAAERSGTVPQVWLLPYPSGNPRRITNDSNLYRVKSVSSDGSTIAVLRNLAFANLFVVEAEGTHEVRQLTFNSGSENLVGGFDQAEDGSIVFHARRDEQSHLWRIGIDGSDPRPITSGRARVETPIHRCLPDGGVVYGMLGEDGVNHVWRADSDGGNARRLTTFSGEGIRGVSPDGRTVLFTRFDGMNDLWAIPAKGGEPIRLVHDSYNLFGVITISPDSRRVAVPSWVEEEGRIHDLWRIIPIEGGEPISILRLPPGAEHVAWAPDGKSLTFLDGRDPDRNLYRQRLKGGSPEQVTHWKSEAWGYDWSRDGQRLVVARGKGLWSVAANGHEETLLTEFKTGDIFGLKWARDGRRVIFTYGGTLTDAVLIRNFR